MAVPRFWGLPSLFPPPSRPWLGLFFVGCEIGELPNFSLLKLRGSLENAAVGFSLLIIGEELSRNVPSPASFICVVASQSLSRSGSLLPFTL